MINLVSRFLKDAVPLDGKACLRNTDLVGRPPPKTEWAEWTWLLMMLSRPSATASAPNVEIKGH
jgi:hypothetical protein